MRDLEFIPSWYPLLRRRRRILLVEGWAIVGVVAVMAVWLMIFHHTVNVARASLGALDRQLSQTDADLVRLNELRLLKQQLQHQGEISARLGVYVPQAKLLATLAEIMPREMTLLDLSSNVVEQPRPIPALVAARGEPATPEMDRKLMVQLTAVAPTDVELANFYARLAAMPQIGDVTWTYSRDRVQDGHTMRECAVTFSIDLNLPVN
jgi:Tfp pilus assembly protein PilN